MPSFNQLSKSLGRMSDDCPCCEDQDRYYIEKFKMHDAGKCSGDCHYCEDEELYNRQIYDEDMYKGFVEQYGPKSVYNFMLVKEELLNYFEKKYLRQRILDSWKS